MDKTINYNSIHTRIYSIIIVCFTMTLIMLLYSFNSPASKIDFRLKKIAHLKKNIDPYTKDATIDFWINKYTSSD